MALEQTATDWEGAVRALYVASEAGGPMRPVDHARAVPGRGIEGDRYYLAGGSFSRWPGPHRECSLISVEGIEAAECVLGVPLSAALTRRNVLVEGVPLEALIGRAFWIGSVKVQGLRACKPCRYLEHKAGLSGLFLALKGHGGLRARFLGEGTIRIGDVVRPA